MRKLALAVVLSTFSVAASAAADQCIVVEGSVASVAALVITASHGRVLEHCAPCGDPPPSLAAAFVPARVDVGGDSVRVDGSERDLAYLYLEVSPGIFENVALRAGCSASGVPEVWDFTGPAPRERSFTAPPPSLRALGWGAPSATGRRDRLPPPG